MSAQEDDRETEDEVGGRRRGAPVDVLRLWHALRKHWQVIAIFVVLGAFVGAALAKRVVPQTFVARAVLRWESSGPRDPVVRQTIVESVTLPSSLEAVRHKLGASLPAIALASAITVTSGPNSDHMSVSATSTSANGAADLANATMDVFVERHEQAEQKRLEGVLRRHRQAVTDAEQDHRTAAAAYETFRRENEVSDIPLERKKLDDQIDESRARAQAARHEAEAARAELAKLEPGGPAPRIPSEVDRKQADSDRQRLTQAQSELNAALVQFSEEHRKVRLLRAEIEDLKRRVSERSATPFSTSSRWQAWQQKLEGAVARTDNAERTLLTLEERRKKILGLEGDEAVLRGESARTEQELAQQKRILAVARQAVAQPLPEFRVLERASPPAFALESPRKRTALVTPLLFGLVALLGVLVWALRRADVVTPKEAAFWAHVPVVGASTWPRDPEMLPALMRDLNGFAPRCQGVTMVLGISREEADLARRVSAWNERRGAPFADSQESMSADNQPPGHALSAYSDSPLDRGDRSPDMQILTVTGPLGAHALRRAGRMADRVLVVVMSGRHGPLALSKIRNRLGRNNGIGILLVGLPEEYAMVQDRVGEVERFWQAVRVDAG